MIQITDTIALEDREIKERFVRAAGPGGQTVNKDATAVELRVDIRKSSLPTEVKEKLIALAGMTCDNRWRAGGGQPGGPFTGAEP